MSKDLTSIARLLEAAEVTFITTQIQTIKQLPSFPNNAFSVQSLGSGVLAITKPSFVWKLNQVAGWGMDGPVTEHDIEIIEEQFAEIDCPVYLNICPLAHPSARELLVRRGYEVCWTYMAVHVVALEEYQVPTAEDENHNASDIEIIRVSEDVQGKGSFITSSVEGFAPGGRSLDLLETLAEAAALRPDTQLYIAKIGGEIAGSAGLAFLTTPSGRVAELYIDSTVPEFRGRGVQAALMRARLADAKEKGFDVAVVTARPGTGSARNAVRVGFELAYTRETFTKVVG
ncbi:hypothetical protein BDV10DRAFT_180197 [Aspergillus recurvatus]